MPEIPVPVAPVYEQSGRECDTLRTAVSLLTLFLPSRMHQRSSLGRMVNQSTVLLMVAIGALILILALFILFHENATATKGYRLRSLERERSFLLVEQEIVNMRNAEAQALQRLTAEQQTNAMVPVHKPRFTDEDPAVALEMRRTMEVMERL